MLENEKGAVCGGPKESLIDKQKHIIFLHKLQMLRDEAWIKGMRYLFDPVSGSIHKFYLNELNKLLQMVEDEPSRN